MFEKMLKWLRSLLDRVFDENSTASDIAISDKMSAAIDLWTRMYEDGGPWCGKDLHSLRLPAAIASEFARLVTLEMEVSLTGSDRATFLQNELEPFLDKLRNYVETGCALGGIIFKPYVSSDGMAIDVVQGDCFYPTTFDSSGRMTGAIFTEQLIRKKIIYTRAEHHEFSNGVHRIENRAFKSNSSATLGSPIDLTEVPEWAQIAPDASIENVDRPLFAYFQIPLANRIDRHSPLGVSVYSEAVDTIRDADEQYGRFIWEFEGGELAVDLAEDLLQHTIGEEPKIPKHQQRLYRGRNVPSGNQNFYEVFSPALRDASLKNGLNTILQKIEYQCGLAYGTISDPQVVEKTAEEIRSSKQRSYATVKDIQKALENALDDLLYAMDKLTTLYKLAPQGSYKAAYDWDDSIINDPTQRKQMFWQYVTAGKYPFWRYLVEFEGYTEKDAKEIETETQVNLSDPFGFEKGGSNANP